MFDFSLTEKTMDDITKLIDSLIAEADKAGVDRDAYIKKAATIIHVFAEITTAKEYERQADNG